ncbi:hypothetical protein EVJ58_g4624 [Rhodofomes roseus]|uniref:Uncharacterized protein n=1 Tax=Rhodofomes roseus TaxID=34475 RepID=A0A4Y9YIG3_9APHY|nr:hypothetical protein EVJ58_g4624 [Rhodofomes roseus]
MELFSRETRAVVQAYAGNADNFLGRTLEWPWYVFWTNAFYGSVDPRKVIAGPQSELVKMQSTNDDQIVYMRKVPDFILHYLTGVPLAHDIDSLLRVTNHQELQQFYMGKCVLSNTTILSICEIKALPDRDRIPAGDGFRETLVHLVQDAQSEAKTDVRNQVKVHLSSRPDVTAVVAVAIFGPFFAWRVFVQTAVSRISDHRDATYDPTKEEDTGDSGDSVQEIEEPQQEPEIPGAAPEARNERPRRGPHQIGRLTQYLTNDADGLRDLDREDEEKRTTSKKWDGKFKQLTRVISRPKKDDGGVKDQDEGKQKRKDEKASKSKGKSKGKGKDESKGKNKGKGKSRDGVQHEDGDNHRDEDNAANVPQARPIPDLELPTFREDPDESDVEGHGPPPEDDGPDNIPHNENEWSEWYHWDTIDGVKERNRMFNAIQRQNPDLEFLL